MPVVIYLHGNASSRLEGLNTLSTLLPHNINLFVVDLPGCGHSEGEYISLGYYESYDVGIIVDFLENLPGTGSIGLWGRSMGASTGLIYAHRDKRIKAICLDSPFANFCRLARELTKQYIVLPDFLINGILKIIAGTIKEKNGMDIFKLNPIEQAENTFQPAIFIHAIKDQLINVQHAIDIFNIYGGEKSLKCSEVGGHNSKRPKRLVQEVGIFFEKYLRNDNNEINNIKLKDNKNDFFTDVSLLNQSFVFKTGENNK
jgi:dipeptidyl aminopeptidase/acylaminoacyl peptidase